MGGRATQSLIGLLDNIQMANGGHSFHLAYGMEAIIPTKIGISTAKTVMQN